MTETCLVIGLGQIGMEYDYEKQNDSLIFTHSRAIDKHPNFKLVGGVDVSSDRRNRFEKMYNQPTFSDLNLSLKKLKPNIVVISTPTETHSSILKKVIDIWPPKVILCEKPLAYEPDVAKSMLDLCKKAGIKLFVNYMRSVDIGVLEVKKRIEIGQIKNPIKANVWYSKGLLNNGSHLLNLLSFWLGKIVSAEIIEKGRLFNQLDPEPDFNVQFNSGTAIFRAAWEESFSHICVELLSPSGRLFYDNGGFNIEWQSTINDPDFKGYKILDKKIEVIKNSMNSYQLQVYDNIFRYLKNEKTTLTTGSEALDTLRGLSLIIKQIKKND